MNNVEDALETVIVNMGAIITGKPCGCSECESVRQNVRDAVELKVTRAVHDKLREILKTLNEAVLDDLGNYGTYIQGRSVENDRIAVYIQQEISKYRNDIYRLSGV